MLTLTTTGLAICLFVIVTMLAIQVCHLDEWVDNLLQHRR